MEPKQQLEKIAVRNAKNCFVNFTGTEAEIDEALGIAISVWAEWDGLKIMRVFHAALEDANFHSEASQVDDMIEKVTEGG